MRPNKELTFVFFKEVVTYLFQNIPPFNLFKTEEV